MKRTRMERRLPLNGRRQYPSFVGLVELKAAVAQWYATHHGVELDPETEVAILFGAKAGLVEIRQCFLNPGPAPGCTRSRSCGRTVSCPTATPWTRPCASGPS
ncbi:aminotransferase class I/II-fold pyridoxal phosphate-dependent enzyme [Streptomyces sp. NPDC003233]